MILFLWNSRNNGGQRSSLVAQGLWVPEDHVSNPGGREYCFLFVFGLWSHDILIDRSPVFRWISQQRWLCACHTVLLNYLLHSRRNVICNNDDWNIDHRWWSKWFSPQEDQQKKILPLTFIAFGIINTAQAWFVACGRELPEVSSRSRTGNGSCCCHTTIEGGNQSPFYDTIPSPLFFIVMHKKICGTFLLNFYEDDMTEG